MKKLIALASFAIPMLVVGVAAADDSLPRDGASAVQQPVETTTSHAKRGIVNLPPTDITSPPMRPMAAIAVSQIEPKLTLVTLRQPFLSRIEGEIFLDHF